MKRKNKQINIYNVQKFFDHKCFSRTIKVAEVHQAEDDYLLSDSSLQVGFALYLSGSASKNSSVVSYILKKEKNKCSLSLLFTFIRIGISI